MRPFVSTTISSAMERMRSAMPGVTFSADIIVGFPGETEEEFGETERFCKTAGFLHLHIFPYSEREGTEAAEMENKVPVRVRRDRAAKLEETGAAIRRDLLGSYVEAHREKPVFLLVEKRTGGMLSGHSEHFVEIRGVPGKASIGEIVPVLLDSTDGIRCGGKLAGE